MKAYLVCEPELGCVVKLADTASKARWAGFREMSGDPYDFGDSLRFPRLRLSVRRIPAYDADDELVAHRRYWTDHDDETGLPVAVGTEALEGGEP